jgi:hypothetical protein
MAGGKILMVCQIIFLSLISFVVAGKKLCCNVKISADQIPPINAPLPLFKACDFVDVQDYVDTLVPTVNGAAYEDGKLIAYVRPDTGESRIFPLLDCLKPGTDLAQKAQTAAQEFAQNPSLFPKDDTQLVVLPSTTISTSQSCGNATAPETVLAFASLERLINGIPIEGPGFQAVVGVDDSCGIKALAHRYRPAFQSDQKIAPHCPDDIVNSIIEDLNDTCTKVNVTIDSVVVKYFDSGSGFIQPVYSYSGSIPSNDTHSQITGSISIGSSVQAIEPVPSSNVPSNAPPGFYGRDVSPTVGRYVVSADSLEWLQSATAFINSLKLATSLGGLSFVDKQYLATNVSMFTTAKNAFINSVQIALNEVHGDYWEFTTYQNDAGIVTLSEIGGLGGNANGSLAYWILHSCEVIPSQTDEPNSFDVWWNIFRGLHSVVGYRTDMFISDGVTTNFGLWLGLNAPIVSSWFVEAAASYHGETYFDTNRLITEPLGRASSVSVCGHADDTACDVAPLPNPTCLVEYWMDN